MSSRCIARSALLPMLCAGIELDPLSRSELQVAANHPQCECLPEDLLLYQKNSSIREIFDKWPLCQL